MNPAGVLLIAIGLFSCAGGLFNWKWFMSAWSARGVTQAIGPAGARVFYLTLGIGVILFGLSIT